MVELNARKSGYAWAISGAGFLTQLIVVWCLSIFGMNLSAFAESIGETAAALAIVSSIFGLCYGGFGVLWGNLADRIGIRKELGISAIGAGVWLICFVFFAKNVWSAAILYGLVGAFIAGLGTGVIPKIVTSWFATNWRGKGIILVSLGGSVAGVLLGIIAPMIVAASGWDGCFIVFGIINVILGIIIVLVVRDSPAALNTIPFGADPATYVAPTEKKELTPEEKLAKKAEDRKKMMDVIKRPITWKFGLALICWQFYLTAHNTYLVAAVTGAGYDLTVGGLVSSLYTAGMAVSMFVFPTLSDKIGRKTVYAFLAAVSAIGYLVLYWVLGLGSDMLLYGIVLIVGFFGAMTPVMQSALGEMYPVELRGSGPGMVTTISLIGRFFGPILCGVFITATGGITANALIFAAIGLAVTFLLLIFFIPNTGGKYGDPFAHQEKADV